MQTRKDLLQAHRLMTQRASQALMLGEPDHPEQPLRRLSIATFAGVMVAVLIAAVFGIIGIVRPGGATGLQKAGMLIVEKETGARYIWCENGKLCPVANYVSARLLAGADAKSRRTVSRNSLSEFERGPLIGISGAPDTLPDAKKLVKSPWSVCVRTVEMGVSGRTSAVTLIAGRSVGGRPLGDDQAVVVVADDQAWLLWRNKRFRVPSYAVASMTQNRPEVAAKWLNALPEGPPYAAPDVPGRGKSVTGPNGPAKVGQIFTVDEAAGGAVYVLLEDGLARISELQMQLLRADPQSTKAYGDQPVATILTDSAKANAHQSSRNLANGELPQRAPAIVQYTDTSALCAAYEDATGNTGGRLTIGGTLPSPPQSVAANSGGADQFVFPPGGAAVAGLVPSEGKAAAVSTYYLVTEGRRFAFRSAEEAGKLGYDVPGNAAKVPADVLELIPIGPTLDAQAAAQQVQTNVPATGNGG
ncbi:type VII secretion protein EccB [Actinomadura sp. HBU206391]|uniref:type VII secretion protein EccB n=1 Tax=Actinomadura sp. HBU206391 TaxID=2731692 RepID=UPI00164EFC7F|nr:type VII secretion protein EccB [Actinomadura sp. HBU206391]MBC6457977.1 type VII secretion protein EccB [Actinomadura sp. HBU206391]